MESTVYVAQMVLAVLLWLMLWVGPICLVFWVGYYLISLRMRRHERARFFLDLVETGLKQSRRIEQTVISVSDSRDASMGVYFHLLAFHLKEGLLFQQALDRVPRLLPPQIAAMLKVGLKIGDVGKTMPACRKLSRDALSHTRGAINYLVLVSFLGFPVNIILLIWLQAVVLPMFLIVVSGMTLRAPTGLQMVVDHRVLIIMIEFLLFAVSWGAALTYIDGPRLFLGLANGLAPLTHRATYLLPWRRKRMQRDFSTMLAILIDAGMAEDEAVTASADCTANTIFQQRARQAVEGLRQGMNLGEAVHLVDDTGEFQWRLRHAMRAPGGFAKAINGWTEALDAKAFQQEQATAQAITTGIVLLNGLVVGFIVVSVFSALISIIDAGTLW